LRHKNCGRHTLDELAAWLESHSLAFATSIPDWSFQEASTLESAYCDIIIKARSQSLLESVAPDPDCLEDELVRIIKATCNERDAKALAKLWGWNGDLYRTLESVGSEFGLTRERIRQIESRGLRRLNEYKFDTPFLRAAIATLKTEVPDLDLALSGKLRDRGITQKEFNIWSIERAAEIFDLDWPFVRFDVGENKILVFLRDEPQLREAISVVRRKTSELGCTNIMSLASELGIGQNRSAVVAKLLECSSSIEWLDGSEHEWCYLRDIPRNRLYNLALKVLSVCPRIRVPELRRAVGRSRRLPMVPPTRILSTFVEKFGLGNVDDGIITANPDRRSPPAADSLEGKMLRVLDTYGPVMDGEEFADKCVEAGMNATSFYLYRTGSPVISALGKGIYCKVGCEVPPGTIEGIVARRRSSPLATDHGWTTDGDLWFGTELMRMMINAGSIRLVPFVSDLVQGEWNVVLPDGTDCGEVTCRESFIWSFRKAFAVLGAEPGDMSTFEFDLKSRKVLVRVGGPGLFEAIQEADGVTATDFADEP
jgi:Sigma-70, region 4